MTLNRHTQRAWLRVRKGNFALNGLLGKTLCGKAVAIVGVGRVGLATARIFDGMGYRMRCGMPYTERGTYMFVDAWTIFASVLVTQLGAPIPAAPMLVVAGTFAATGNASYIQFFAAAVVATVVADSFWFIAGRIRGRKVLNSLVRFSLSLDTAVRVTRSIFERHGAPVLTLSKFVPGVGLIAAPLLGTTAIASWKFLVWDCVGACLWAGLWLIGGGMFRDEVLSLLAMLTKNGNAVAELLVAIGIVYLGYAFGRRIWFRYWLAKLRISPDELAELMKLYPPPVVFDARPAAVRAAEPFRIPGALALDLESSARVGLDLAARLIVVYCVCPNEATAKRIIAQLRRKNIHHVRALRGGLDAWERCRFPVELLPAGFGTGEAETKIHSPSLASMAASGNTTIKAKP